MFSKIALSCGALTDPRLAVVGLRLAIRRLRRFLLDFLLTGSRAATVSGASPVGSGSRR